MSRKAKGKGFKMKGHALPGINQRSETPSMKDGRSASSPFQQGFGPQPVGEEPIDQRSSGIPIDRDEGLTIQEKIERRIREKQAAEEKHKGFGPTPSEVKETTIYSSPLEQLDKLPSEIEDLEPYTGDNAVEQINDLEDRIGFINENKSTYGRDLNEQEKKDLVILNKELEKIRNDQRMEDALKRDEELGPNPDEVD